MNLNKELEELNKENVYSLLLFALFKLKDIPEYSTLCELPYVLDTPDILKFFEYFGGMTIKVPTIEEVQILVDALYVYEQSTFENKKLNVCVKELQRTPQEEDSIIKLVLTITDLLKDYNFNRKVVKEEN